MKKAKCSSHNEPSNPTLRTLNPLPDFSVYENLRINPEKRICPSFDYLSIAEYRVADPKSMGIHVVDNCAHEHIM